MRKISIALLLLITIGCQDYLDERTVKSIITESYIYGSTRINEVDILKEDIYSLPFSSLISTDITEKYNLKSQFEYKLVRYIFKTNKGAYRMFYFVDLSNNEILDKSSNPNDFYIPLYKELFSDIKTSFDEDDIIGQGKFDLYSY